MTPVHAWIARATPTAAAMVRRPVAPEAADTGAHDDREQQAARGGEPTAAPTPTSPCLALGRVHRSVRRAGGQAGQRLVLRGADAFPHGHGSVQAVCRQSRLNGRRAKRRPLNRRAFQRLFERGWRRAQFHRRLVPAKDRGTARGHPAARPRPPMAIHWRKRSATGHR